MTSHAFPAKAVSGECSRGSPLAGRRVLLDGNDWHDPWLGGAIDCIIIITCVTVLNSQTESHSEHRVAAKGQCHCVRSPRGAHMGLS